jgi:exodeoxyribonuclease V
MIGATSTVRQPVELSREQREAVTSLVAGVRQGKAQQTLGGYAGTGKTTSMRAIKDDLPNFAVAAYTGQAADVLKRKGMADAGTIHSQIYFPEKGPLGKITFRLRHSHEMSPDIEGFLVDEASMVGRTIHRDLMSFGLPCIFVGDHGQLPPIEPGFNLMEDPDYRLETIHRNAGDIARFAEWLRLGRDSRRFRPTSEDVVLMDPDKVTDELLAGVDQTICAFNSARVAINAHVRKFLGRKDTVEVGDRVMCLRNHRHVEIRNGMQGLVRWVSTSDAKLRIHFDPGDEVGIREFLEIDPDQFGKEKGPEFGEDRGKHPFDYAYAITAHKAQGAEWDEVLVVEQWCRHWDHKKWSYTAASRARRKLYWATQGGAR